MKYGQGIIDIITQAIRDGKGRVGACREAGISYDTFLDWYKGKRAKTEFSEAIKKAEEEWREKGKAIAVMSVFKAMPNQWQAGAWWLERNFGEEFAGPNIKHLIGGDKERPILFKIITYGDNTSPQLSATPVPTPVIESNGHGHDESVLPMA